MKDKKLGLTCYFCGQPLTLKDGWLEIYDQKGKTLTYPGTEEPGYVRVVLFSHTACGPDTGYQFALTRLGENWDRQLRGKIWWCPGIQQALDAARKETGIARTERLD